MRHRRLCRSRRGERTRRCARRGRRPVPRRTAPRGAQDGRRGAARRPGPARLRRGRRPGRTRRMTGPAARLAADTLALVQIASESRGESTIIGVIRSRLAAAPGLRIADDHDAVLVALPERRSGAPLVLLAGHVDTVTVAGAGSAAVEAVLD